MDRKTQRALIIAFLLGFGGAMLGWLLSNALHLGETGRIVLTGAIVATMVIAGITVTLTKKNRKV